jgi:hypothetical protein
MKIKLGRFAREAIEALLGDDIDAGVEAALRHYVHTREQWPQPPALSPACAERPAPPAADELEVALAPEVEKAFEREAQRADELSAGQLAVHAVLAYLADVDRASGREAKPPALL